MLTVQLKMYKTQFSFLIVQQYNLIFFKNGSKSFLGLKSRKKGRDGGGGGGSGNYKLNFRQFHHLPQKVASDLDL